MPIFMSFSSVPELAARPEDEREAAVKQVSSLAVKHWEWWLALGVAAGLAGVGAWLGGRGLSGVLGAGIGGGAGGVVHHLMVIYIARKYYAAVLAGQSAA